MTPKERADYIIESIFKEQHVDDRALMICLSTKKIALWVCDMAIDYTTDYKKAKYWTKVKEEILKY